MALDILKQRQFNAGYIEIEELFEMEEIFENSNGNLEDEILDIRK